MAAAGGVPVRGFAATVLTRTINPVSNERDGA